MAQIIGNLRDDKATYGERLVLKKLKENLPKEYTVYVECPLPAPRNLRYPDFIVVTNYGVIVLEVKDWVQIQQADAYHAVIRTRANKSRDVSNPVNQARDMAMLLSEKLRKIRTRFQNKTQKSIPWGYAVVLPNIGTATITQLRRAWGKEFVLHLDDLDAALILSRLKVTLPSNKVRSLKKYELDYIRATINPTVFIEHQDRPPIILDNQQERIISEPVKTEVKKPESVQPLPQQQDLFVDETTPKPKRIEEELPDIGKRISTNTSIRLVRGVAGSGKTLVLAQRARYLSAQYPEWNLLVLTYNKALQTHLQSVLRGTPRVKVYTLHGLCWRYLAWDRNKNLGNFGDWIQSISTKYLILNSLGASYIEDEIKWMKDTGILDRQAYLSAPRKGRGRQIGQKQREQIFDLFQGYQKWLVNENTFDWEDVPHIVMQHIDEGKITPAQYNAVLIDEAQDFAPVWMQLVTRFLDPDTGVLFLADDPTQSIYRFYSWREKGVEVVGRTRWLRVPYRNTYEIYQAAYQIIASDENLMQSLKDEGLLVAPDLESDLMRHGSKPFLQRFNNLHAEITFIKERIHQLLQTGVKPGQIAVLHRHNKGVNFAKESLKGTGAIISTFHALKGLEYEAVFLCQLQETSRRNEGQDEESAERRLVYMAMTRAREYLFMGYEGRLPKKFKPLLDYVDHIS